MAMRAFLHFYNCEWKAVKYKKQQPGKNRGSQFFFMVSGRKPNDCDIERIAPIDPGVQWERMFLMLYGCTHTHTNLCKHTLLAIRANTFIST